jgi:phenylacetate-CoA ligase
MAINWRKPIIFALLKATQGPVRAELEFLRSIECKSPEEILVIQTERITKLLLHAWEHTDYYKEVLSDTGVVINGKVRLDRFEEIPILTKEIIRQQGDRLRAKFLPSGRKPYMNRTGGSTGEPTVYWQDNYYWDVNVATKLYHFETHGKQLGELEMKIWGSDRDIVHDTTGWTTKAKAFLYNRHVRACARLSDEDIGCILKDINQLKPRTIWGYTDCIYTIAGYILRTEQSVHSPAALFGGGGTLFPHMRETIQEAFDAPMINMYGSREMGDVACECEKQVGLHVSSHSHRVEIVDVQDRSVIDQDGDIIVTSLHNYAMPFIRYRIGDRGRLTDKQCICGRGFPLLESVLGRSMESFVTAQGAVVSPIYLITVLGAALDPDLFRKFQLVQDDTFHVTLKVIVDPKVSPKQVHPHLSSAVEKISSVMGKSCNVSQQIVDDIPPTDSGKYLYTVCKVPTGGYSSEIGLAKQRA